MKTKKSNLNNYITIKKPKKANIKLFNAVFEIINKNIAVI